jgi:predicted RNase H-like HicB family nuclease
VKLGQVVWRKLDEKTSLEEADGHLIDVIYELLKNKKYNLGIILSEFATKSYIKDYNKSNELVKCINKSLAYYLNDNKEKCRSIINSIDWSATDYRFKLAAAVLEEKYADACELMKRIGNSDDMMEAYREWPLFSNFRESELFKDTFKEIYKIDFNYVEIKPLEWDDIIKGAIEYFNVKSFYDYNPPIYKNTILYPAIIEKDEESDGWNVTVPDIFGGVTCGDDYDSAISMAKDMIRLMLTEAPGQCFPPKTLEETKENFPNDEVIMIEVELN